MYLIKNCASCGRKIRFPIDQGKIKVRCQCGYSFTADPDDASLYKDGTFDLQQTTSRKKRPFYDFEYLLKNFEGTKLKHTIITALYNTKYNIQNFKILPAREQKKLVMHFFIAFLLIVLIVCAIVFFLTAPAIRGDII